MRYCTFSMLLGILALLLSIAIPSAAASKDVQSTIAKPTPEEWALVDEGMAKRIQMRDDMERVVAALKQLGEAPHKAAKEREAELEVIKKEIDDYADELNRKYELRIAKVQRTAPPATQPASKTTFSGCAQARSVIFMFDGTGVMMLNASALKVELMFSIAAMDEKQSFNILLSQDGKPVFLNGDAMLPATRENKQKALEFLDDRTIAATSDPLPGLTKALQMKPDVMYIVTDGDFPDDQAVVAKLRELNPKSRTRINTVALVDRSRRPEEDCLKTLQAISKQSGGEFHQVTTAQLQEANPPPGRPRMRRTETHRS